MAGKESRKIPTWEREGCVKGEGEGGGRSVIRRRGRRVGEKGRRRGCLPQQGLCVYEVQDALGDVELSLAHFFLQENKLCAAEKTSQPTGERQTRWRVQ